MSKLIILDHPLIQHKMTILRDKDTSSKTFREMVKEITTLMVYEITRDLELEQIEVETPLCKTKGYKLSGKKMAVVPILRAGLGMMDGILELIPSARVGHIGLIRNEKTHEPEVYFCKLPKDLKNRRFMVVDPMLATGGSAEAAITILKQQGVESIQLVNLVASPEGVMEVQRKHPDVDIYIAALDEGLDENAFIVPGLGDAGDRFFGTK